MEAENLDQAYDEAREALRKLVERVQNALRRIKSHKPDRVDEEKEEKEEKSLKRDRVDEEKEEAEQAPLPSQKKEKKEQGPWLCEGLFWKNEECPKGPKSDKKMGVIHKNEGDKSGKRHVVCGCCHAIYKADHKTTQA